jgi:hypothetical protein
MKEKLFRLKKGSQRMYLFQNVKGITKMAFPHFKRKQLRSINFDLIQYDGLVFAKMIMTPVESPFRRTRHRGGPQIILDYEKRTDFWHLVL